MPPQEREIWELVTMRTAAETLGRDDTESQIREPMPEHQGIHTDKNQSKKCITA